MTEGANTGRRRLKFFEISQLDGIRYFYINLIILLTPHVSHYRLKKLE